MEKLLTFESFSDELDYEKYFYLVEDILLLEERLLVPLIIQIQNLVRNKVEFQLEFLKSLQTWISCLEWWTSSRYPQQAWATGRVNSFITGVGGARKADADLWKKAKAAKARKIIKNKYEIRKIV